MYILFNQDGSLKATNLADFIVKGEDNQKSIFIGIEGLTEINDLVAEVDAKLPAEGVDPIAITCETDSETIDGHLYYGWTLPITANLTAYEGIVYASLIVTDEIANTTFVTYNFKLVVNPSVIAPDDAEVNISIAQYRLLLSALNQKRNLETFPLSVYAVDESGNQTTYNLDTANMPDGEVVKRGENQEVWVRNNPTQDYEAIHKKYVDDQIKNSVKFIPYSTARTFINLKELVFSLAAGLVGTNCTAIVEIDTNELYICGYRSSNILVSDTYLEIESLSGADRWYGRFNFTGLENTTLASFMSTLSTNEYYQPYALKLYRHDLFDGTNYISIINNLSRQITESGTNLLAVLRKSTIAFRVSDNQVPVSNMSYSGIQSAMTIYKTDGTTGAFNSTNYTDTVTEL